MCWLCDKMGPICRFHTDPNWGRSHSRSPTTANPDSTRPTRCSAVRSASQRTFSHFLDEWRLVGEDAVLYDNRDTLSALGVHVVNGWARAHPRGSRTRSQRPSSATARSAQTQSGPSPNQRFVGNRAHGRSECEEARSSALPFRANRRESAVLEVGPTQRPLAPQRRF